MAEMIYCLYCKEEKTEDNFAPSAFRKYKKGNVFKCRSCAARLNKLWRSANKEKCKEYAIKRRAVPDIKEKDRIRGLKTKYGITPDQYHALLKQQNYCCAICLKDQRETKLSRWSILCVDHDHKTGKLRKLLCAQCNKGLGCFKDSTWLLTRAFQYLIDHEKMGANGHLPWQKP